MKWVHLPILACLSIAFVSCNDSPRKTGAPDAAKEQQFKVQGILVAIGFADREVTIEHEEIPNYMPAMTMPFPVKDMREVERLSVGDAIRFDYFVTDKDSWITNVRKIDRSLVRLAVKSASAASVDRVREGDPLPAFDLTDDQGRPISAASYQGKPLLLTFMFTRCPVPNYCPLMSQHFARLHELTGADPKLSETQLLSVTIDPEYDTPAVLAAYASRFRQTDPNRWRFATGEKDQVSRFAALFALQVRAANETIEHGLATALVDRSGVIRMIWRGNGWSVEEILDELGRL